MSQKWLMVEERDVLLGLWPYYNQKLRNSFSTSSQLLSVHCGFSMKQLLISFFIFFSVALLLIGVSSFIFKQTEISGAPPGGETEEQVPDDSPYAWLADWKRPVGPARVGLQVGHWNNEELPEELKNLIGNTGASGGGKWEWEVNYAIAELTAEILKEKGVIVDILPATVPPGYIADAFIAIHADGSLDRSVSGYKSSPPWRDWTGKASVLNTFVDESYSEVTHIVYDPNISKNMRGYYAFSYWRYEHAVHPMTPSIILETGFLTNSNDQKILVHAPEIAAKGLAEGILNFLTDQKLLQT